MKYLLLGLVLMLVPWFRSTATSMPPTSFHVDAWFREVDTSGVSTDLSIVVETRGKAAEVRMAIDRTSPACVSDPHDCPAGAISANTVASAKGGDFVVAPDLTWATLHMTISVYDAVTRSRRLVRIDLDWAAAGTPYAVKDIPPANISDASAHGGVATASDIYLADGRSWSGSIVRF